MSASDPKQTSEYSETSMRHLQSIDIPATFRRGRPVEQFLGRSPTAPNFIRHIELRPARDAVEVWVFDVEDIGSEGRPDLYDLPYLEPDGPHGPVATFHDPQAAVLYAQAALGADPARWVNLGVAASDYVDFMRAGRPLQWPPRT